jgi:acyl-coenzyme A synthetase/AMP-(fatty) acid ligase
MAVSAESGRLDPVPERFNLARYCLGRSAAAMPDQVALTVVRDVDDPAATTRWTYAELEDAVLRLARGFRDAGLHPGHRVFIRMGNSADYAITFFAANAAGLVPIPGSSLLQAREVAFMVADAEVSAVISDGTLELPELPDGVTVIAPADLERLRQSPRADYVDTDANDPAFLVYTSGTQKQPKGVLHAQRVVWGRRPMYQGWYGYEPGDVVLHAGAFNWTYTLGSGLFDPWANGLSTIVYTGPKDPTVWPRLIRDYGATIMAAVPTVYRQILKYANPQPGSLGRLRHGLTAGEALSPALASAWFDATGLRLYEALGMSEISTYISSSPSVPPKPGSPGKPQAGRRVAILDPDDPSGRELGTGQEGLIAIHRSDPGLMLTYWNRPEEMAEAFRGEWFIGGDLGVLDEDGYLWFKGRADDLMNALGYRVSPLEVESVLARHPDVADVAVAEVKVREDLSVIAAFFVPREGAELEPEELIAFGKNDLAAYKLPRAAYSVSELPRSPNGKLRRRELQRFVRVNTAAA